MNATATLVRILPFVVVALLSACTTTPQRSGGGEPRSSPMGHNYIQLSQGAGADAVVYALGLLDTGYRFGGTNPEAGLDCSGMIGYVFEQVAQVKLPRSAAQIVGVTRPITRDELRPGDLVFFNTLNRPYSHVGLYIGDGRFVHAPSTHGKVRIERLDSTYFTKRFEGARTLLK